MALGMERRQHAEIAGAGEGALSRCEPHRPEGSHGDMRRAEITAPTWAKPNHDPTPLLDGNNNPPHRVQGTRRWLPTVFHESSKGTPAVVGYRQKGFCLVVERDIAWLATFDGDPFRGSCEE
jgi:hypothetical protein